mmetsp:Transcript_10636/g.21152  ORF Transcript_10636/g.21152 Transcript_10636/m.21152 type:complete len:84 (+) Transcript_10636:1224-1475(+)
MTAIIKTIGTIIPSAIKEEDIRAESGAFTLGSTSGSVGASLGLAEEADGSVPPRSFAEVNDGIGNPDQPGPDLPAVEHWVCSL